MPGQVAEQSTLALTNSTLPYLLKMADKGVLKMLKSDKGFAKGLNTYAGFITCEAVAKAVGMMNKYGDFAKALKKLK